MVGTFETVGGADRGAELQVLALDLFCRLAEMSPKLERTWKPALLRIRSEAYDLPGPFRLDG